LRQTSGTGVPASACLRAKEICFLVNCDFFIYKLLDHLFYHRKVAVFFEPLFEGQVKLMKELTLTAKAKDSFKILNGVLEKHWPTQEAVKVTGV
jgi:hypothetical protein